MLGSAWGEPSRPRDALGFAGVRLTGRVPATALPLDDAVELVSAWVSRATETNSIRSLLIKGESFAYLGLRAQQTSADVDVLVEPGEIARLDALLREHGWIRREELFAGQWDAPHSRTFVHPEWPCDLDVHTFFPGFLADPRVVFESLWDRGTRMTLAHTSCSIPDAAPSRSPPRVAWLRSPSRRVRRVAAARCRPPVLTTRHFSESGSAVEPSCSPVAHLLSQPRSVATASRLTPDLPLS